jgi:Cu/Ag efflux pump CusA
MEGKQWPHENEDSEAPPEFELGPESIAPLPQPGADTESRRKYAEQCKQNRAERVRKRKERSEIKPDEEANDPAVIKRVARQMRNRESAERSRLKKQAYTDQLEAEVARLKGEKEQLACQVQDLQTQITQPVAAKLSTEQLALLKKLQAQVQDFQQRESRLQLPPLKPLRKHHTMDR